MTGEEVAACLGLSWERLSSNAQPLYEELASQLNVRYLAPLEGENAQLKALVRDYREYMTPLRLMNHKERFLKISELFERSFQLLGEEQKVSV